MQNKITYKELVDTFREFNEVNGVTSKGSGKSITGIIVFKESNWEVNYPLNSRSYRVSSDNKAFIPGMSGYSIFGSSLDGTDDCVRLEQYIDVEFGGEMGWHIDYCYLEEHDEENV